MDSTFQASTPSARWAVRIAYIAVVLLVSLRTEAFVALVRQHNLETCRNCFRKQHIWIANQCAHVGKESLQVIHIAVQLRSRVCGHLQRVCKAWNIEISLSKNILHLLTRHSFCRAAWPTSASPRQPLLSLHHTACVGLWRVDRASWLLPPAHLARLGAGVQQCRWVT